jgi:hypothetical protein
MTDYIELKPDDVIRVGDEWSRIENDDDGPWWVLPESIGELKVGFIGDSAKQHPNIKFRRPRSTLIRETAVALLRYMYGSAMFYGGFEIDKIKALREAIGISVEELREGK